MVAAAVAASASHFLTKVQNADAVAHTNMQIDRQSLKVYTRAHTEFAHASFMHALEI